jgi:hypothetical protein
MATVTPNFNWPVPTSTDLVKDGATAIEALGDSIDGSLVDLKGGTTGQVLSKTSGTDMDFTWVTTDDANAIQNSIVNAKGDLIGASANDTPAILSVGANGETLVADSSTSTGLRYQSNFSAGKNKIINGDFGIWQRGTSITTTNGTAVYTADRFTVYNDFSAGSSSFSQQTFAAGTAPVAGYEGTYFGRLTCATTSSYAEIGQRIEDVRQLAGQTATFSFWAKASTNTTVTPTFRQFFGSGGSGNVNTFGSTFAVTTSWQRFSITLSIPSISGKTIGTGNYAYMYVLFTPGSSQTFDSWGWQLEAGNTATAFQTATGTIQGELAACNRYYWRISGATASNVGLSTVAFNGGTTPGVRRAHIPLPTTMRVRPSIAIGGTHAVYTTQLSNLGLASLGTSTSSTSFITLELNLTSGGTNGQAGWWMIDSSSANDFLEASAEL